MKTRIILTVGCVGKTHLDKNYSNVYDFDKHTLEYKYDKTGFEYLSNEEFKSLPNRKINDGWFDIGIETLSLLAHQLGTVLKMADFCPSLLFRVFDCSKRKTARSS